MKPLTAIAVSGGIDSLMAAHLLKEKGHNVVGVHFVTGYEDPFPDNRQSAHIAESHKIFPIAKQLGIDIKVLDCRIEFKKKCRRLFYSNVSVRTNPQSLHGVQSFN